MEILPSGFFDGCHAALPHALFRAADRSWRLREATGTKSIVVEDG